MERNVGYIFLWAHWPIVALNVLNQEINIFEETIVHGSFVIDVCYSKVFAS